MRENGAPLHGRLTEAEFQAAGSPAGEPGQVVVAGPHVQPGYLNDPAEHETKLQVAGAVWHQTGDAGYFDERGRLWLLGRSGARITDHHGTVYPLQVECAAREDAMVRRAALLAHQNRRVLAIEAKGRIQPGDMKSRLDWAFIDTVKVLPRIPVDKRHNSKIDYPALRAIFGRA